MTARYLAVKFDLVIARVEKPVAVAAQYRAADVSEVKQVGFLINFDPNLSNLTVRYSVSMVIDRVERPVAVAAQYRAAGVY